MVKRIQSFPRIWRARDRFLSVWRSRTPTFQSRCTLRHGGWPFSSGLPHTLHSRFDRDGRSALCFFALDNIYSIHEKCNPGTRTQYCWLRDSHPRCKIGLG